MSESSELTTEKSAIETEAEKHKTSANEYFKSKFHHGIYI